MGSTTQARNPLFGWKKSPGCSLRSGTHWNYLSKKRSI